MLNSHHHITEFKILKKHSKLFLLKNKGFGERFVLSVKICSTHNIKQQSLKSNKHSNLFLLRMNDFEKGFVKSVNVIISNSRV
jgi:hypothetical protein